MPKRVRSLLRRHKYTFMFMAVFMLSAMPMLVGAQSDGISIDTGEIFSQTNVWIDLLLPVFAIGAGIAIAAALLNMLINMIKKSIQSAG